MLGSQHLSGDVVGTAAENELLYGSLASRAPVSGLGVAIALDQHPSDTGTEVLHYDQDRIQLGSLVDPEHSRDL